MAPNTESVITTAPETTNESSKPAGASATVKAHPKYSEMVTKAIATLQERGGSSKLKILRFVVSQFDVGDELRANTHVKLALKNGLQTGTLLQVKGNGASGSFRLSDETKKAHAKALKPKPAQTNTISKAAVKNKKPATKTAPGTKAATGKPTKPKSIKALTKEIKDKKVTAKNEIVTKAKKTAAKKTESHKTTKPESKKSKKPATETKTVSKKSATETTATTKKIVKKSSTKTRVVSKKTPTKAKKPKAATPKKTNQKKAATKTTTKKETAPKAKNATKLATK